MEAIKESFLTVQEVAEIMRVDRMTVCRWIKRGQNGVKLKARRPGRDYRIKQEWLDRFIEESDAADRPEPVMAPAARARKKSTSEGLARHNIRTK